MAEAVIEPARWSHLLFDVAGRVRQIGLEAVEYRGDVTYPVIIELDEGSYPGLRWGMTAMVEIETP